MSDMSCRISHMIDWRELLLTRKALSDHSVLNSYTFTRTEFWSEITLASENFIQPRWLGCREPTDWESRAVDRVMKLTPKVIPINSNCNSHLPLDPDLDSDIWQIHLFLQITKHSITYDPLRTRSVLNKPQWTIAESPLEKHTHTLWATDCSSQLPVSDWDLTQLFLVELNVSTRS